MINNITNKRYNGNGKQNKLTKNILNKSRTRNIENITPSNIFTQFDLNSLIFEDISTNNASLTLNSIQKPHNVVELYEP